MGNITYVLYKIFDIFSLNSVIMAKCELLRLFYGFMDLKIFVFLNQYE